jgi:sugar phosphate isomerase/epimerase
MTSTRRGFLGGAAGAFAGAAATNGAVDNESAGFKLGIASYSLRDYQRGLAIKSIRELQITYVSVKDVHIPMEPRSEWQRGRRDFERAGLKISSGGAIYFESDDAEDIRSKFEYAKGCGMPMIVAGPRHSNVRTIEKFAREYDIKVAIHNHGPEDKQFPTPQSVLEVVKDMDPRCGLCIDLGHSARAGANVVESLAEAGSRLLDIHIKDLKALNDGRAGCPVGDGAMPIPGIFRQLQKMGYTGCVNLEYEVNDPNPMLGMHRSLSYMRGVLAGMKG